MELMKAIAMRKSTRDYKPEQISNKALDKIIYAGCAAPVGQGAYNSVHLTVVQNPDLLDRISKTAADYYGRQNLKPLYGAPTMVVVSCRPNETYPGAEIANAACIIENMTLAATDMGLGSLYLWGILAAFKADSGLLKELKLPAGFKPTSCLALGFPSKPLAEEKELKQTIEMNRIH
jgi:nitroreductase